jgi:hypothetical protein
MNYTEVLSKLTANQQICVIALLLISSFGAGYAVSNHPQDHKEFNPFAYKAETEVNKTMYSAIMNPTEFNRISAHNSVAITYRNWVSRESGNGKEEFDDYLDSCEDVLTAIKYDSPDIKDKIRIMEEKKRLI